MSNFANFLGVHLNRTVFFNWIYKRADQRPYQQIVGGQGSHQGTGYQPQLVLSLPADSVPTGHRRTKQPDLNSRYGSTTQVASFTTLPWIRWWFITGYQAFLLGFPHSLPVPIYTDPSRDSLRRKAMLYKKVPCRMGRNSSAEIVFLTIHQYPFIGLGGERQCCVNFYMYESSATTGFEILKFRSKLPYAYQVTTRPLPWEVYC